MKLPSGARFVYQLSPNDPLTFEDPRAAQRAATRQADPLNKHPLSACPVNTSKFDCNSVAELPGAPPQPWLVAKPGVAEGRLEKQTIKSAIQKIDRPFSVLHAGQLQGRGSAQCTVDFVRRRSLSDDGQYQLTTLNNLIAASKIPPTVAVFVENVPRRRLVSLVANPEFADFMAKELVPWIRSHYNVTNEPKHTVVTGYSAGGLASAYVALRHPEVFGNVLTDRAPFGGRLNTTVASAVRAVLSLGDAVVMVLETLRQRATSWSSNSSRISEAAVTFLSCGGNI